ncbi:MAG: glycosyl hydrolase family 18 protein [Catonella sp.]|uniref:glycosyl hydrolase family 18 protein n=1 Tax=Catonella sp. TaxID=2382125 RepID=UPI003FA0D3BB
MKKKIVPITVVIPLIVIAVISVMILIAGKIFKMNPSDSSNKTEVSLTDYYKVPEGEARLIIDIKKIDANALLRDKTAYIPYEEAEKMMPRIYYDAMDNVIVYTTGVEKFVFKADIEEYEVNGKKQKDEVPSFIEEGGNLYVSVNFIAKRHEIKFDIFENPGRVVIFEDNNEEYKCCVVKESTELREGNSDKEVILDRLEEGEKLYLISNVSDEFLRVFTEDGITGYVAASKLDTANLENKKFDFDRTKENESYTCITREEPIVLGWHQVTGEKANGSLSEVLSQAEGVNVVSPTWFSVADSEGEIMSFASENYVNKLHNINIDVWPLISDFNKDVDFKLLLTSTDSRTKLINNIIYFVEKYNLDGINVDFEKVKSSYAKGYIQFLRELSIEMRARKKVLSIDNYIPLEFNAFYNIAEQGIVADYLCVMAYDEHYSGSAEAGSVSSLNWVKTSVENTAKYAPMKKIIVGLPFYTRIWRETKEGKLETKALGMDAGLNLVHNNNAKKAWNNEAGQYYAEWKDGKDKMKIWLEEERSLAAKLGLVKRDEVAGIAFWKLGLERKAAWNSVVDWLK